MRLTDRAAVAPEVGDRACDTANPIDSTPAQPPHSNPPFQQGLSEAIERREHAQARRGDFGVAAHVPSTREVSRSGNPLGDVIRRLAARRGEELVGSGPPQRHDEVETIEKRAR